MTKKTALITGASRGIGRAVAIQLAQKGYHILINYASNQAAAESTLELVQEAGSTGELLKFDVSNHSACTTSIENWVENHPDDYIEVLVNNAGIRQDNLLLWMEEKDWNKVVNTSLSGFFNVTQSVLKPMLLHKQGRIVNIASLSGIKGLAGQTNYSAAKGGLIAATKALAQEIGKKKVTVNAIAPGYIQTDMVEELDEKTLAKQVPLGRFGTPQEVAALVDFLVSPSAAYITGECISINGGLYT